jgi:hypothetical protein
MLMRIRIHTRILIHIHVHVGDPLRRLLRPPSPAAVSTLSNTCTHANTHTYTYTNTHKLTHTHIHTHTYTHTHTHTHVHARTHSHPYAHIYTGVLPRVWSAGGCTASERCASHCPGTLLLLCCYTVVTLLSHCWYTVVTLSPHCCYSAVTLLSHGIASERCASHFLGTINTEKITLLCTKFTTLMTRLYCWQTKHT